MWRYVLLLMAIVVLVTGTVLFAPSFWRAVYPFPYRDIVEKYAQQNGLDPFLVAAVIRVESSFRPHALSPKGARGLMQIMPATGQWIAAQIHMENFSDELLYVPETNVKMGTLYLRNLKNQFDGNLAVSLAAYNGGRGNVKNWLEKGIWSGEIADIGRIPFPETRYYVWRVLRVYKVYRELYVR